MLSVPTYIDKSPIHGIGLFAQEDIKAEVPVWVFVDYLDTKYKLGWVEEVKKVRIKETNKYSASFYREVLILLEKYGYQSGSEVILCADNARFMNHSYEANTYSWIDDEGFNWDISRGIKAGEEITCNYADFDEKFKGF